MTQQRTRPVHRPKPDAVYASCKPNSAAWLRVTGPEVYEDGKRKIPVVDAVNLKRARLVDAAQLHPDGIHGRKHRRTGWALTEEKWFVHDLLDRAIDAHLGRESNAVHLVRARETWRLGGAVVIAHDADQLKAFTTGVLTKAGFDVDPYPVPASGFGLRFRHGSANLCPAARSFGDGTLFMCTLLRGHDEPDQHWDAPEEYRWTSLPERTTCGEWAVSDKYVGVRPCALPYGHPSSQKHLDPRDLADQQNDDATPAEAATIRA